MHGPHAQGDLKTYSTSLQAHKDAGARAFCVIAYVTVASPNTYRTLGVFVQVIVVHVHTVASTRKTDRSTLHIRLTNQRPPKQIDAAASVT